MQLQADAGGIAEIRQQARSFMCHVGRKRRVDDIQIVVARLGEDAAAGRERLRPPFKYKPWLKSTGPKQPTEESGGANGRYSQRCKYSIRQNRALMAEVRSLVGVAADITEQICGEN